MWHYANAPHFSNPNLLMMGVKPTCSEVATSSVCEAHEGVSHKRKVAQPLLTLTLTLQQFYRPFNERLAHLMGDESLTITIIMITLTLQEFYRPFNERLAHLMGDDSLTITIIMITLTLQEFYRPFNERLAHLMGDDVRWLWGY